MRYLGGKNPRLHTDEVLIALTLAACTDENARRSLEQLPKLKGCQVHTSVMLSEVDIKIYKKLGVDLTSEPVQTIRKYYSHLYLNLAAFARVLRDKISRIGSLPRRNKYPYFELMSAKADREV